MTKADHLRAHQSAQVENLQQEHLNIDDEIVRLTRLNNPMDATLLRKLKKRRLAVKEQLEALGGTTLTNGRRKPPKGVRPRLVPVGYRPGA